MKRWGFHGMPDMHGVTKSHRRIGCIGSGRAKVPIVSYEGKKLIFALHLVKSLAWYKDAWASGRQVPVDLWTEGKLFSNKIAQFDTI